MELQRIVELINREESFNLISHVMPDGDSIGSLLALGEALQNLGKKVALFSPGILPKKYSFLKGSSAIAGAGMDTAAIPVVLALDCSDPDRFDLFKEQVMQARQIVNIDHHVTNRNYGTINLVEPDASATGEIIFNLLQALHVPLTTSICEALYVAIATDTGSFKYDNTTAAAHRVVAALLKFPLKTGELARRIFDQRPLAFYRVLQEALSTLELHGNGKIAIMTMSREMLDRYGAAVEDMEGIVNYTRDIEGVEIGILFYVENDSEVKVGFRSRHVDISVLAGKFNGGGHAKAAGCRIYGPYAAVREQVLRETGILWEAYDAARKERSWKES